MKNTISLLFSLLIYFGINAQSRFDDVIIKTNKITDQIYMLEGSGGNIGVFIGEDGIFMIDDQFAPLSDKIKAAITALSDKEIIYLVNTHWHGDHTGGNENFGKDGAIIVAHENVRSRLSTEQHNKAFNRKTPASPKTAWPTITFDENLSIYLNDEQMMLIHVHEAHTDGDAFVFFPKSNVLHMGDCFFKDRFPYIDLGSGGSVVGAIKAIETALMLADDDTVIIPGHGKLATKSDLNNYHQMLTTIYERVYNKVQQGVSLDDIKKANLTEDYPDWGNGFINDEKIIDIIWTDIDSQLSK